MQMQKISNVEARSIGYAVKKAYRQLGFRSQEEIEALTGVDQSQISRVFRGEFRKLTENVMILCKYAGVEPLNVSQDKVFVSDEQGRERILKVFDTVWDGSKDHADAIAHLILATRRLSPRTPMAKERKNKRG